MTIEIPRTHLHRLDETTWSYLLPLQEGRPTDAVEEINMQIPAFTRGKDALKLVSTIARVFEGNKPSLTRTFFRKGFRIRIQNPESPIAGTWQISMHKAPWFFQRMIDSALDKVKQYDPFTRQIKQQRSVTVDIKKVPESYLGGILHSIFWITLFSSADRDLTPILSRTSSLPLILDEAQRIRIPSFRDPFTRLAARCFKTIETFYTMEREHRGSYRFTVEDGLNIRLVENIIPENETEFVHYQEENRACVRLYRDFLIREFGQYILAQTQLSFNINFDLMIEQGLPLYPDHVSKCNVGANNIEIYILERLWGRLHRMRDDLLSIKETPVRWQDLSIRPAIEYLANRGASLQFSIRSLRGIYCCIHRHPLSSKEPTVADLDAFVTLLLGTVSVRSVRDLSSAQFNTLVDVVMPSDRERRKAFTGRRIRHLSVMGYHTMGEPNTPNPCRDLFELMHVFDDLQKEEDWKNFFELLSHVVVKKSLVRPTPVSDGQTPAWHVGFLIPAPRSSSGQARWYCTDAYCNDGQGNVNYVLLPACTNYRSSEGRALPMIKLYRSTASNRNAVSWQDSIAADLNPYGAPGSLQPDLSFEYERKHFEERTIPLWMGYLIIALQMKESLAKVAPHLSVERELFAAEYRRHMMNATDLCKTYLQKFHPEESISALEEFLEQEKPDEAEGLLMEYGRRFREDPRYKINQDLALIGHSLGGALAQAGTYTFSAKISRIPLPGHQFICYSSDGPAIDNWKDAEFMEFGQHRRKLFEQLHIRWEVYHQFEYGDVVPEAGGSHLGTTKRHPWKDSKWLVDNISVFRPVETAKALSIVAAPTHGRRIGTAVLERDYTLTRLSPADLREYDHSWWLQHRIGRIWGYRFFNSPRTSELVRRNLSRFLALPMRIFKRVVRKDVGDTDERGVSWQKNLHCSPKTEFCSV